MSTPDSPDDSAESEFDSTCLDALKELARKEYGTDEIEIDDDADISEGDDGTWVQAWVFLSNDTLREYCPVSSVARLGVQMELVTKELVKRAPAASRSMFGVVFTFNPYRL